MTAHAILFLINFKRSLILLKVADHALGEIKFLSLRYDGECESAVVHLLTSVASSLVTLLLVQAEGPARPLTPTLSVYPRLRRLGVTVAEECLLLVSNWIRHSASESLVKLQLSVSMQLPSNGWDRWSYLDSMFSHSKCTKL
ncbi:hypothetical protein ARMGADRAFT_1035323 [Armillaria gallica]|uniref:Uncharacterized protein n=1 Tax=Armillaria gallica TaxID=47427 RepID=A0A2H3D7F6_ARMGA|nr:hypothetical protein ARMGADRAFT_1035323 [Armillaria gallica]